MKALAQIQKDLSDKLDGLCTRPTAKTQQEVDLWQSDKQEYLKEKSKNVAPLPAEWKQDVKELLEKSQMYYDLLDTWYDQFGDFKMMQLMRQKKKGKLSEEEYKNLTHKIKEHDYGADSRKQKIENLYEIFEEIVQIMQNNSDWVELYRDSNLFWIGDVVRDISVIDMFAWQLPNADPEFEMVYRELASILAIFLLVARFGKREDDNRNPFEAVGGLDNILELYIFSRHKH
jgi:hypothetical protein